MAKKNSGGGDSNGSSKGVGLLIAILIIITWLSVMALLIKCDVGGFGSGVLRPVFKDVPIINKILPDASDEEVAKESDYPYDTLEEALTQIKVLEETIETKDADAVKLNDRIAELEKANEKLLAVQQEQDDFEKKKNQFYDEIVYGESAPDADTYIEWYNEIDSEHAEEIYKQIVSAKEVDSSIADLSKTYEEMDAKSAADILQSMKTDMDTVALIMNNMSSKSRGEILAQMEPDFAASVTKKLLP